MNEFPRWNSTSAGRSVCIVPRFKPLATDHSQWLNGVCGTSSLQHFTTLSRQIYS